MLLSNLIPNVEMSMKTIDLPLDQLQAAPWNPNRMDEAMQCRLKESVRRYGLVENLVVRPKEGGDYEVLSGNQRLEVLRGLDVHAAPCVVVELPDSQAMLLAQALNRIEGEDDLGLKAVLIQNVLETLPQEEVLALLPESCDSLKALANLGQDTMAGYLEAWEQAQAARLKHMSFQLLPSQLEVVEAAMERLLPRAKLLEDDSPNVRGRALFLICMDYLEREEDV